MVKIEEDVFVLFHVLLPYITLLSIINIQYLITLLNQIARIKNIMLPKRIDSNLFVTEDRIIELFKFFGQLTNTYLPTNSLLFFALDEADTLRVKIEKLQTPIFESNVLYISTGIIKFICDAIYIVLSDNSIFPHIGKSSHIINIPTLHVPNWTILDLAMQNTDLPTFDEDRLNLHEYLFSLAIEFIIFHEAAHLLNGHTNYLLNFSKRPQTTPEIRLTSLDYQTLEFDADFTATFDYLKFLQRDRPTISSVPKEDFIYCFILAVFIIMFGFPNQILRNLDDLTQKKHLTSSVRFQFFIDTLFEFFKDSNKDILSVEKAIDLILKDIKNLVALKILPQEVLNDLKRSIETDVREHMNKISRNWTEKWLDILLQFTYVKLRK